MNETLVVPKLEHSDDGADVANALEKIPTSNPISLDSAAEDSLHRTLRFLSTASSETICGILVGLAACTYLVFGRLGLVLIGALGGIVLHANWEGRQPGSSEDAQKEKSLEVIQRILDVRAAQRQNTEDDKDDEILRASFEGFKPETAAALEQLVDAVIRDYVGWWYQPILPTETSFPSASRQTLTKFILAISQHLSRKRHADTFLDFLTNSSSIVIVFLSELSNALTAPQGSNVSPAEAVYTYLSANPESSLAHVLNEEQQSKKFKMVAEDILQNFLEKSTYNCDPARAFLREILGGLVLKMSLETFSKPEWINGWIVYLLEDGEPDISQAIDAGMGGSNTSDQPSAPTYDFDGNVGNIGLAKPFQSEKQRLEAKGHKKRLSKAEEAMEEAMEEAQRLSQLIAEEDAKRVQPDQNPLENAREALVAAVEQNDESLRRDMSGVTSEKRLSPHTPNLSISNGPVPSQTAGGNNKPAEPSTPKTQSAAHRRSHDLKSSPQLASSPAPTRNAPAFTNFDQMISESVPVALQEDFTVGRREAVSLTLHNANTIIHDDSTTSDRGRVRSKPNADYLIQIEPASSDHPGWMIVRRYSDFENLHEVLRRIAQISGVKAFTEQHHTLPNWKEHTKPSLRGELERYLRDALWYKALAESEGMKRFLEKDQGQSASTSTSKNGFPGLGWPTPSAFETMGKGMLDVLTSAPKGVAEGGKAIGGGITGVFSNIGNLGQKRTPNGSSTNVGMHTAGRSSTSTLPRMEGRNSIVSSSEDSLRTTSIVQTQPSSLPPMERRPSYISVADSENEREPGVSARSSMSGRRSVPHSRNPSKAPSLRRGTPLSSPTQKILDDIKLPPLPNDISDDYGSRTDSSSMAHSRTESGTLTRRTSTSTAPSQQSPGRPSLSATRRPSVQAAAPSRKPRPEQTPITESETKVAVELLFAVINELYTLSSAWNIRRTLLNAAKQFLLRPANPSLVAIQTLIQDSVIAANTSDAGIASHLRKLRENTLPTAEEAKLWPAEMSPDEKDKLRVKARKLLVERGIPTALTGVMGQAATGEAVGRVFDCLQVDEVAKGLMFGLILQGVRAVTQ